MPLPSVTQPNFNGKSAGFYISAALQQVNSLEYFTMMENVKYKSNITRIEGTSMVHDATCDFTENAATTLALTEKTIEPKLVQVNLDICKKNLLESWEALTMRAGAGGNPSASFEDYIISYIGEIIASNTEKCIWTGNTANSGEFTGMVTGAVGLLLPGVDATVVQTAAAASPFSATNIISNLQAGVDSVSDALYGKEDLHIYMSPTSYQMYLGAVSTLGYVNAYQMNNEYKPLFQGFKIALCNGMGNDELVIAQKSNMFFGTDLLSDATRIQLLDMSSLDGSDNLRVVARYSAAVQTGVGADIVRVS
jgi:hypothetical protein